MKNIFKIIRADLRHIKTNVIALCVIIGLTVIPALYSWFNILSNWDPYGQASTSRIKVAVVSVDKGTSLEGTELNVGDNIIDALKTNNTIGWQFVTSSDEAIEGVYSGQYYAALVVPENFSKNLISFLSDSMEHPQLKYYCNQKANAIAPKITDKAKTAVQQQVNQTFIDTIVSTIAGTGDSVIKDADKETGSLMDAVINRLTSARTTLSTYDVILNSMLAITDLTSSISSSSNSAAPQVYTQLQLQQQQLITLQALVNSNSAESLNELSSALSNQMSQIQSIMSSLTELYSDMNMDVADLSAAIKLTSGSLTQTKELLSDLKTKLDNAINTLNTITEQDTYGLLSEMLNADANTLGDFLSAPVNITTEQVYAVKSYGTSASPFYTILALWFGGLILVAIMHTPVHPAPDIPADAKRYEKFFGRYFIFFAVGQLQALLITLGNLLYIGIQCYHPFLYWVACAFSSFVFTFFMYSLTVAFGNIGEALGIVLLVIQVAGSGGTFPIEVLPNAYQIIYRFLLFPYSMDALRECIAGMYRYDYIKNLAFLSIYIVVSLIIGLFLQKPFEKMNHMIERSKEKSGVML